VLNQANRKQEKKSMRKLAALVNHILTVTGLPPEQLYAFADQGDLYPIGRDRGPLRPEPGEEGQPRRQVELGLFRYDGVIQIERYPGPGADFAALITSWLKECDQERDGLADPSLDIELNTKGGDCDIQIAVEFEERLEAVEDPQGNIPFDGTRWSLVPVTLTPVEELVKLGAGK
jgi:hypothetical protein